ncbi:MAG: YtxH domain-containing protein [Cyclobacteriaceae bacterium]
MDDSGKTLTAFVLGVAAGALLGLAMAPTSGEKTRQRISDSANDTIDVIEDAWEEGSDRIKDIAEIAIEELEKYAKRLTKNL